VVRAVTGLAADRSASLRALKLGERQDAEIERNRTLLSSPTMPALDRYTGVVYDALDAPTLDPTARAFARQHLVVHSALFGLLGALDPIPAYRLSHDSRVPGLRLRDVWRAPLADTLTARQGVIVDLRSEGYADLGPVPARPTSAYVRVIAVDGAGRRRALAHFNKHSKGCFVRALLLDRPRIRSLTGLLDWARGAGFVLGRAEVSPPGRAQELELSAV